ncbi:hypothetical protein QCA50_014621 [Cerrena zonata]|uniref:SET domain-containing protein n=1 Tax=Cerrena zonata TaxID=2478898 RepID=A0AAW0FNZ5_9APHY
MAGTSTLRRRKDNKRKEDEKDDSLKVETTIQKSNVTALTHVLFVTVLLGACIFTAYRLFPHFFWEETANGIQLEREVQLPFKVVDLPGKGKGVIATRDIAQGELLFREEPLFLVPTSTRLTPTQRQQFYNLSYVNLPSNLIPDSPEYHEAISLAIFQTNSIAAGNGQAGIFPRVARLNHGCSKAFNSVYSWRANEGGRGLIVVHALKRIKEGEVRGPLGLLVITKYLMTDGMGQELLTTYLDTKRPRDARR